jgi:hypothetical protein
MRAEEFKIRDISGDLLAENLEREIKNFKIKVFRHFYLSYEGY